MTIPFYERFKEDIVITLRGDFDYKNKYVNLINRKLKEKFNKEDLDEKLTRIIGSKNKKFILGLSQHNKKINMYRLHKKLKIGYNALYKHLDILRELCLIEESREKINGRENRFISIASNVKIVPIYEENKVWLKNWNTKTKKLMKDIAKKDYNFYNESKEIIENKRKRIIRKGIMGKLFK